MIYSFYLSNETEPIKVIIAYYGLLRHSKGWIRSKPKKEVSYSGFSEPIVKVITFFTFTNKTAIIQ